MGNSINSTSRRHKTSRTSSFRKESDADKAEIHKEGTSRRKQIAEKISSISAQILGWSPNCTKQKAIAESHKNSTELHTAQWIKFIVLIQANLLLITTRNKSVQRTMTESIVTKT